MDAMIRKLEEASMEGNVATLLELIEKDPLILDRQLIGCYNETPLHVSSMLGHIHFTNEILSRKPKMAVQTSIPTKSTPLHLAAANGCLEIVKSLLTVNPDVTCFALDRNGRNPCHIAAVKANIDVLKELIKVRPSAVRALAIKDGENDSILHLSVKYNQFEVVKFLVDNIIGDDYDFVNLKDYDGNTILHLAVADKQIEVIKFIIGHTKVEVNAKNADGYTALDMLAQGRKDVNYMLISEFLKLVGALKSRQHHPSFPLSHHHASDDHLPIRFQVGQYTNDARNDNNNHRNVFHKEDDMNWADKKYDVLMLVASLIATMAFTAGVSPFGGTWQDHFEGDSKHRAHTAGYPIMAENNMSAYARYTIYNTISFISALSIVFLLISGLPLRHKLFVWVIMGTLWVSIASLAMAYSTALKLYTAGEANVSQQVTVLIYVWNMVMGLVLWVHTIRLIVKGIKKLVRFVRSRSSKSSSII